MSKEQSPFLEQVRNTIRVRHYSIRTEQAYTHLINRGGAAVVSPLNDLFGGDESLGGCS